MSERTTSFSFVRSLATRWPGLGPILEEHINDNFGEILPHVFFGDLTRYVLSLLGEASRGDEAARRELREILDYLEETYAGGDVELQELIFVSFLENLPRPDEDGAQIREMVGPHLRRQLLVIG